MYEELKVKFWVVAYMTQNQEQFTVLGVAAVSGILLTT